MTAPADIASEPSVPPLRLAAPAARRWRLGVQLVVGCALVGFGVAGILAAGLGADPFGVLIDAVADRTGMRFGTVNGVFGLLLVAAAWLAGVRPGIGSLVQPVTVGLAINAALPVLTGSPLADHLAGRVVLLGGGVVCSAVGVAAYLACAAGAGPLEAVTQAVLRRTRFGFAVTYNAFLLTLFAGGAALGGSWGVGTAVAAIAAGPLVARLLPVLTPRPLGGASGEKAPARSL
jgi:uncharacterized membrane protein YczE